MGIKRYEGYAIGGEVVKQDERYVVHDNYELEKLVLGSTTLNSGHSTTGHKHPGVEEVYFFIRGIGKMQIDNEEVLVQPGDIVLVPDGAFHRVFNNGYTELYFVCVFNGKRTY